MAQILPTQQPNDGAQLVKPTDWPHFMVDAVLTFTSDDKTPTNFKDSDDARMAILNTLNWFEAHDEYKWPDFARVRLDFSQIMRFRRALVSDVFVSLQRAGKVKISLGEGDLGSPDSVAELARKRKNNAGSRRLNERKRLCKREDESDNDTDSNDTENSLNADDLFLVDSMRELIKRTDADPGGTPGEDNSAEAFADRMHDSLVNIWTGPVADYDSVPEDLERKQALWDQSRAPAARESSIQSGLRRSDG